MAGLLGLGGMGYGPYPGSVAGTSQGNGLGLLSDTLTGLGVGLLNQQPSSTPISPFAGLGQGLQYANQLNQQRRAAGQQQFQNALLQKSADREQQTFDLEKQKADREQKIYDQQQQYLNAYGNTLDPDQQALFHADPGAYLKNINPGPTDVQKNYRLAQNQGFKGSLAEYQKFLAQAGANNTTVNMPPAEHAYNVALGTQEGGEIGSIAQNAGTARATLDQLTTVQALRTALQQSGNDVSALAPLKQKVGEYAQAVGLDPDKLPGYASGDSAGLYQALGAVTNRLALDNIGTGKEGSIPANNFSEADRNFVVGMSPQLGDTPEGFQAKVLIQQRVAQRNLDKESLWNSGKYDQTSEADYRRFKSDWAAQVAAHPLFSDQEKKNFSLLVKTGSAAPPPQPKAQQAPTTVPALSGPGWQ